MHCMGERAAKDALFDGFAEVAKALASGRRAEIVDLLAQGERSVDEISDEIGQSVANTSHHLRALARAGLLATRREGTRGFYRLGSGRGGGLWAGLRGAAVVPPRGGGTRVFSRLASERVGELWAGLRGVAAEHVAGLDRLAAAY